MKESGYQLIICIINAGYSEAVMDAAGECGARGGTVIQARGTANKEAEESFKITIQPEKEMVMLVVPTEIKENILHALYKSIGLNSPGHGIAFSLPVDNVVGLNKTVIDNIMGENLGQGATPDENKSEKSQ